jgi:hypothetical protein
MDARLPAALLLALAASACGGEPLTGTPPRTCPELHAADCVDVPTYTKTLQPILARSCVPCHWGAPGDNALWPLTEYGDVAAWNNLIKTSLLNCSQPPARSPYPFTEADRATIVKWTLCNHPK